MIWVLAEAGIGIDPAAQQPPTSDSIQRASIVAGYHAGFLCSAVFLARRDPAAVAQDELGPALLDHPADTARRVRPVRIGIDRKARMVSAVPGIPDDPFFRGEPRRAVFKPGRGCTLLPPGARASDAERLPPVPPWTPPNVGSRSWPDGDLLPRAPLPGEVDSARLVAAVDSAFADSAYSPHHTLGVVVVYRGRIVTERYAPGWSMHTQYRTWSTAKSIASALVGILVAQGKLDLQAPAPIAEWRHPLDPRGAITIEHLLHMSSGLVSGGSRTPLGYWGGIDIAADAAAAQPERAPGTRWKYSNYDTILLLRAAREVLGDDAYASFPRRALLDRIGMHHTFPETDPFGNYVLSSQVYSTPRDLARFGLLYLNDGVWNGQRILPEGWVAFTVQPAPAHDPGGRASAWGYGAHWWLLGRDPRVPADAYTTDGRRGQHVSVVPSRQLVVVRTGLDPEPNGWDQAGFVADVLAAIRH
ncbi:MAG: serine hydrolase domain-containing protein [Gemmatimonadales bacterium]